LRIDYAFALMARLYPRVGPLVFLRAIEGIACLGSMTAYTAGLVCFAARLPPLHIFVLVLVAYSGAYLVRVAGLHVVPGMVPLGVAYAWLLRFGPVLLAGFVVSGMLLVGWKGTLSFFAARIAGGIAAVVPESIICRLVSERTREIAGPDHHIFTNAYRYFASLSGQSRDVSVSASELAESNWRHVFEDLAEKAPELVATFSYDVFDYPQSALELWDDPDS